MSWYQLQSRRSHTPSAARIQVDALLGIFFHLLIGRRRPRHAASGRWSTSKAPAPTPASTIALVLFGAAGMMLMTCSVELLMVFIGLEISSISTYILAGFRKSQATGLRVLHQVLPARLLRHRILPLRHRTGLRRHRFHQHLPPSPQGLTTSHHPHHGPPRTRHDDHRPRLQGLRRTLPRLDARRLPGRTRPRRRPHVHRPQGRAPSLSCCASPSSGFPAHAAPLVHAASWILAAALDDHRQPRRAQPDRRQAHARLLLASPTPATCSLPSRPSRTTASPQPASTPPSYAAMNVGALRRHHPGRRVRRARPHHRRLHRPRAQAPRPRRRPRPSSCCR